MADIQLFVYDIETGSGGRSYTLDFEGRNDFENNDNKLKYETSPNMTDDEIRKGLAKKIGIGLLTYLLQTEQADDIEFSLRNSEGLTELDSMPVDNWRNWIFEVYGKGKFDKESSRSKFEIEFGYNGDKVSEKWRIRTDIEFNKSGSMFTRDDEEFKSSREKYRFQGSIVRSLHDHWSAGIFSGIQHNTYNNLSLSVDLRPAIEYNVFPYKEVLQREITFAYKIGYIYNSYQEPTIFGKSRESLFNQSLNVEMRFRQPWGNIRSWLSASAFLQDFSKNRFEFRSDFSIRVYQGLSVRFSTNLNLIRDQLTLPAGSASLEDVLLQQKQIATDFEIGFSVGLSYTFGSAFNNIINTRL